MQVSREVQSADLENGALVSRRNYDKKYEYLLPEYYPVKLIGAFISVDFITGCSFNCSFCISKRHPSRQELFESGLLLDLRVSPKKVYQWLKSMPSYQAGVQIRIGHDTDAGLEFEKSAELIDLIEGDRSIVYLSRKPFTTREIGFFSTYRRNLLLKMTATPRSQSLGIFRNPLDLVSSAGSLDPRMLYWVVGPLVKDSVEDTIKILDQLPRGSSLFLKKLNYAGLPQLAGIDPLPDEQYAHLEEYALGKGHMVTEWFCQSSLARIGRGFFDVDKITDQPSSPKRDRELGYCRSCGSFPICHGELDLDRFRRQLSENLTFLGLHLLKEPHRTGARSFEITVGEPSSRGEESFLNNAIYPPVSININTREQGRSQGGSFCNIDPVALRRWYENGFLPVTELNNVAEYALRDLRRMFSNSGHKAQHFSPDRPFGAQNNLCL